MVKAFIFLTAFSQIFLSRFGIEITKDFSLAPSYLAAYAALGVLLYKRYLHFDVKLGLLFLVISFTSSISYVLGREEKALSSLFLYWFIYFPFVFVPTSKGVPDRSLCKLYLPLLFVLAIAGICQFFCQFLFKPEWLFDYRPLIPDYVRNKNDMNTVIIIGDLIKSNGFFLLEPSIFSQWMALGLLFNNTIAGSFFITYLYLAGLAVSFSGTGIIMVLFTLLGSLYMLTVRQTLSLIAGLFLFLVFSFYTKETLLLSRLEEFKGGEGVRTTSAAMRFLTPRITVAEGLSTSMPRFFFGNGPGTINKVAKDYEGHDPAWAKLLFEYGVVGTISLIVFLLHCVKIVKSSFLFVIVFSVQWILLGGHLLTFDVVALYLIYLRFAVYY